MEENEKIEDHHIYDYFLDCVEKTYDDKDYSWNSFLKMYNYSGPKTKWESNSDVSQLDWGPNQFLSDQQSVIPLTGSECGFSGFNDTSQSEDTSEGRLTLEMIEGLILKFQSQQETVDGGGRLKIKHGTMPKNKLDTIEETVQKIRLYFIDQFVELLMTKDNRERPSSRIKAFIGKCIGIIKFLKNEYGVRYLFSKTDPKQFLSPLVQIYLRLCSVFQSKSLQNSVEGFLSFILVKSFGHEGYKNKVNLYIIKKIQTEYTEMKEHNQDQEYNRFLEIEPKLKKIFGSNKGRFEDIKSMRKLKSQLSNPILNSIFEYAYDLLISDQQHILEQMWLKRSIQGLETSEATYDKDGEVIKKLIISFKKGLSFCHQA